MPGINVWLNGAYTMVKIGNNNIIIISYIETTHFVLNRWEWWIFYLLGITSMIFVLSWRRLSVFVVVCFLSLLLWNIIGSSSYNSRISKDLLFAFCIFLVFLFFLVITKYRDYNEYARLLSIFLSFTTLTAEFCLDWKYRSALFTCPRWLNSRGKWHVLIPRCRYSMLLSYNAARRSYPLCIV